MWRNEAVREYAEWCRGFNTGLAGETSPTRLPVGFYGLDIYSLFKSADAVISFLEGVDKKAAERARERYATLVSSLEHTVTVMCRVRTERQRTMQGSFHAPTVAVSLSVVRVPSLIV